MVLFLVKNFKNILLTVYKIHYRLDLVYIVNFNAFLHVLIVRVYLKKKNHIKCILHNFKYLIVSYFVNSKCIFGLLSIINI